MNIDTRISKRIVILDVRGKLAVEEGAKELRTRVRELTSSGHRQIVLNLGNVGRVDSTGIEALVSSYTTVTREGGELKFASVAAPLHHLLDITKLLTVFETYEEESQAIDSFFPAK